METAVEVLVALADRYAFGEVAALIGVGAGGGALTTGGAAATQQLCAFGQRLLDLDAEDFGQPDEPPADTGESGPGGGPAGDHWVAGAIPPDLRDRALACRMPQAPGEPHRGALGSLRPAYRLLLEVIDARWRRRETSALVAAVHIASEYAPLLVWEQVLGHAGDPARLPAAVTGPGSAWGDLDDARCPQPRPVKSAAQRAVRVATESPVGWRSYLDRQHSHTARGLGVCGGDCARPCTVLTRLSTSERAAVTAGCRLALAFADTPIVRLRHAAPVGHGFGVPSPNEVLDAWARSRQRLARTSGGDLAEDGFPLPGFARLIGAMAGADLPPDTLLADTAAAVVARLRTGATT